MNCVFTYDFTRTDSGPDAQKLIGGSNIEISNYNFEIQKKLWNGAIICKNHGQKDRKSARSIM